MRRSPDAVTGAPDLVELQCACATARRVARLVTQLYDAHLRPINLESTQFALLSVLGSAGPSTQVAIGRRFGFEKTTLSRNLKLLRERGWIADSEAVSARERPCALTAEGRKRLKAAQPAWRRAQDALRASMGDREWQAMWTAFRGITAGARTARHAPTRRRRTARS